jgi:hypothetical protein
VQLRVLKDQEIVHDGDHIVVDVVESAWSRFADNTTVGYAQVGDNLVWRVRRDRKVRPWRVLHEVRTGARATDLARAHVPGTPPREGDHLELVDADDHAEWRFCTVRHVDLGSVVVDESVGDGAFAARTYSSDEFFEVWGLANIFSPVNEEEGFQPPPFRIYCEKCGIPDEFFARRRFSVRCRECGEYLPDRT